MGAAMRGVLIVASIFVLCSCETTPVVSNDKFRQVYATYSIKPMPRAMVMNRTSLRVYVSDANNIPAHTVGEEIERRAGRGKVYSPEEMAAATLRECAMDEFVARSQRWFDTHPPRPVPDGHGGTVMG